jgi:putative transposase
MQSTLETCRHLYNDSLGERSTDWDVDYWGQMYLLPLRKKDNKYYKQVHSQVLQDVLLRLDKAYQAFFKKIMKYPRFKKREKYNSFTYPQYGGFRIKDNKLVLSCIGAIKFKMHRIPVGTLKRCTVTRDVGQWYCCMTTDDGIESIEQKSIQNAVGVDRGIENLMALSTDEMVENPKHLIKSADKIKKLQKALSNKKVGSKNSEKARIHLAKAWRKVRHQRLDYCHKESTKLASRYDTIVFEDLRITNMVKNHRLASAILDATWGKLRRFSAYKVERRGGRCLVVNPSGTSQKCSGCGQVVPKDLHVRMHECPSCGLVLDRDHNAALNILKLGLEQALAEKQPLLVRQRISKFASRKQEAHRL